MGLKEILEKMTLRTKKTAAIVGMSAALGATAVGCGQKEVPVDSSVTTTSVDDTKVVEEETPVVEAPVVETPVVETPVVEAPVTDKEIVVEEVTMDMLNERLAELVTKYEGTYTEDELKFMLATANASFMPVENVMEFTGKDMEFFENSPDYLAGLIGKNRANMLDYISSGTATTFLNGADLSFNPEVIAEANWVYGKLMDVIGTDKEKSIKATYDLNYFISGLEAPGVELEYGPVAGDNVIFETSAYVTTKGICFGMNEGLAYPEASVVYSMSPNEVDNFDFQYLEFLKYLQEPAIIK